MKPNNLLSCFFLAIVVILLSACAATRPPEFRSMENLRLKKLGFNKSGFDLDLVYHNPNRSGLQLKKADGEVWVENNFLGRFEVDTLIRIPGNSDFQVPVNLEVDMSQILKNSAIAIFKKEVILRIEGHARIGKAGVFIRYPIRYEGKHNVGELWK